MQKRNILLTFILMNLANAAVANTVVNFSSEKHIGGRFVKKITSLTSDESTDNVLRLANPNDGYQIEVERTIEGFAGPVLEKDLAQPKVKVGLGIEFTSGFTFSNSKKVKSLVEADQYAMSNPLDYFKAASVMKMIDDETVHFDFFAGMVLAPEIGNFGIWGVATGGWDFNVTKKEKDLVEIEFSLINSKMASFFFDKLGVMLSYDVGKDLEKGYTLTLNLKDAKAREAYERIFKGNIQFAQTESIKNKNIKFEKNSSSKSYRHGTGIWARTPYVAWFLLNSTHHMVNGEKEELTLESMNKEKTITSSYEEESTLDFVGRFYGVNRSFEADYNLSKKEFEIADNYEVGSNVGSNLGVTLEVMKGKTQMPEFFKMEIPTAKNSFYHTKLEVKYTEKFMKHLMSPYFDTTTIRNIAKKALDDKLKAEIAYYKYSDPTVFFQQRLLDEQFITMALNHIKSNGEAMRVAMLSNNIKGVLDNYALMMRSVYHSPALYKAFVDYSKRCGTEINFSIENQAFAKKEKHVESQILSSCLE